MASASKKEGNISDSFASLSGTKKEPLPDRFRERKLEIVQGREKQIKRSWKALLRELKRENGIIGKRGPRAVPQIDYEDLQANGKVLRKLKDEIQKTGVVVVRGVIPEDEARAYKDVVEDYVKKNPSTKGSKHHSSTFEALH
jgi:uncharacterized protein YaaR (DUF327 family)